MLLTAPQTEHFTSSFNVTGKREWHCLHKLAQIVRLDFGLFRGVVLVVMVVGEPSFRMVTRLLVTLINDVWVESFLCIILVRPGCCNSNHQI